MSKSLRVAARQESGSGRAAVRTADVGVGKPDATGSERVDVGCGNIRAALDTKVRVPHVVGDDDEDVGWSALTFGGTTETRSERQDGDRDESCMLFHTVLPAEQYLDLRQ